MPQVKDGKLRALVTTLPRRSPVLPDVPTIAEAGLPGFDVNEWQMLLAPAGTPPAVLERMQENFAVAEQVDEGILEARRHGLEAGAGDRGGRWRAEKEHQVRDLLRLERRLAKIVG